MVSWLPLMVPVAGMRCQPSATVAQVLDPRQPLRPVQIETLKSGLHSTKRGLHVSRLGREAQTLHQGVQGHSLFLGQLEHHMCGLGLFDSRLGHLISSVGCWSAPRLPPWRTKVSIKDDPKLVLDTYLGLVYNPP